MSDKLICEWCGDEITPEWQNSPDWDGETCSIGCEEDMAEMANDLWDEDDWDEEPSSDND